MRKAIMKNCLGSKAKMKEVGNIYSIDELKTFPNIHPRHLQDAIDYLNDKTPDDYEVIGFTERDDFKEEEATFIQVYVDEIERYVD